MKISRLDRREFIESMLLLGLTACGGRAAHQAFRSSSPSTTEAATGPLFEKISRLCDQLVGGRIGARQFVHLAGERLMELELDEQVLADWSREGPVDRGAGKNGFRTIHTRPLWFGDHDGVSKAIFFFCPPGCTQPPHEHHNLMSVKRVLKGSYHVRQYERVRLVEPGVVAIRQVSELPDVTFHGPTIAMTDDWLNVHWFGAATSEPVLALNLNVERSLRPADTFYGPAEKRPPGPYFVDPTGVPDAEGLIRARTIEIEQAEEFARRPLSAYPSRLATPAGAARRS